MSKKIIGLLLVLSMMVTLGACGSDSKNNSDSVNDANVETETEEQEKDMSIESDIEESENEEPVVEEDENAPEYINANSIKETTNVSVYTSSWVDSVDHDFRGFDIKIPNELEVSEAYELHEDDDSDDTGVTVNEFFEGNDKRYSYIELSGKLPGCALETTHRFSVSIDENDAPVSKEVLEAEYKDTVVEAIEQEGFEGFIVKPDITKADSGFASVVIMLNLGSYEHAYGTDYFTGEIYYQGGLLEYADVDFDEITETLMSLISVGVFEEVN